MESSSLDILKNRSSLHRLRERDIDLLICCELHVAGTLRDYFAKSWSRLDVEFVGAWVSHSEDDGESDLIVVFEREKKRLILLVENKIDAQFQPDQGKRYSQRAKRWQTENPGTQVRTILIAPKEYADQQSPDSEFFDYHISYEDLVNVLKSASDPRTVFLANALQEGIEAHRRGYVSVPHEAVTRVWREIANISRTVAPRLNMKEPDEKPGKSTYIYFRQAEGIPYSSEKVAVVIKGNKGFADLQFGATMPSDLRRIVSELLESDMSVEKAKGSTSVRLTSRPINFKGFPSGQVEQIRDCLLNAERLREFFVRHEARLRKLLD